MTRRLRYKSKEALEMERYHPEIGQDIREYMKRNKISRRGFAKEHCSDFGLTINTLDNYLKEICRGYLSGGYMFDPGNSRNYQRLSLYLHAMGLSEDDSIISKIKNVKEDFEFPPKVRTI
jgi:hypothetical protein